jgi:hypothetical protein
MKCRPGLDTATYLVGAALLASGLTHMAILQATGASWAGPLSLRKPATFGVSFGLTVMTITWVSSFLQVGAKARARILMAFAAASVVETALITGQAWRGVPSHFNVETTADAIVAQTLAVGGATLVVLVTALTWISFRSKPGVAQSLRIAIRTGFLILMAAMATGALMIAKGMRLVFAGDAQHAYAAGGSLKPTHAVTMHALLVLPLFAWLLSRTDWSADRQTRAVVIASAAYLLFAAAVAAANLGGLL